MTLPLPIPYWEVVRRLPEPFELMKFTLIYDGDLPSAGNKRQPVAASRIRNELHHQLADLWDSHIVLRQLARTARTQLIGAPWGSGKYHHAELPDHSGPIPPLHPGQIDYCTPILVPEVGCNFIPLVRNSLHLACAVDVLFLRHEEPLNLMKQGGDLDGRLKTLFDSLKMPEPGNEYRGDEPTADPLYVVMEDDALISDMSIKSGRLLGNRSKDKHAVRLTIEITVKVLRVFEQNQCLIGG
jgi:hypothetical protein